MAALKVIPLALFSFLLIILASGEAKIPVLIWSNTDLPSFPTALEGHTLPSKTFYDDYLHVLSHKSEHNMLVFIQDKLTMEDITHYADVYNEESDGAAFHNLKHYMDQSSTHLPGVSSPDEAIKALRKAYDDKKVHVLKSPYSLTDLPALNDGGHLVVVDLPETEEGEAARGHTLRKSDGVMGHISSQFEKQNVPYTALYTARTSSPEKEANHLQSSGRHLLNENVNANYTIVNTTCILFYVRQIDLKESWTNDKDELQMITTNLPHNAVITDDCGTGNSTGVKLTFDYTAGLVNFTQAKIVMTFNISKKANRWKMKEMLITYASDYTKDPRTADMKHKNEIFGPYRFCYHCSNSTYFNENNRSRTAAKMSIKFHGLQIQQTDEGTLSKFSNSVNDCIGFFTIPILASLTVLLVLILILFFGICMINSINTMDRFDDPKGKSIQVGNVDG